MNSLSRLMYAAFSLPISPKLTKAINNVLFSSIWKNKCHYIRKKDIVKSHEEGALNVIDLNVMNGVLKLKWLKSFMLNRNSVWFAIPNGIFDKMGGVDFLLPCDLNSNSLPIKLSDFHQQVLLYWKLIFKQFYSA